MSIVNTDELTFILTSYGLQRVAEALADESVELNLSKIKVGDANGSYYEPREDQTELVHPIEGGSFYVLDKELLEDQVTVSFHTLFPEKFGNCDIREVGLFETVDGEDYLFAVGTQQPFVKPSVDYNYLISVDYYLFLKSANLASVYEQIILDPDSQLVTEQDLQDLMSTILFTQGNLSEQIGRNSHIIGLNRGTTLYDLITKTTEAYGYTATYNNYAALLGYVNPNNVFGYWVFNYPKLNKSTNSITDIGKNGYNFSSDQAINLYTRSYSGFMPMLNFEEGSFYYLGSSAPLVLVDEANEDMPFTMIFAVKPHELSETHTLLARSNYATGSHAFEINELTNGAIQVKLFSDSQNYATFTSGEGIVKKGEAHSLILSYNNIDKVFTTYFNGNKIELFKEVTGTYTHMSTTPTTLYAFSYTPSETIYANKSTSPVTALYNADGSPYEGTSRSIKEGKVCFGLDESSYNSAKNVNTGILYAWTYNDGIDDHTIYTKTTTITSTTVLYNSNYSKYVGQEFAVVASGQTYVVQYVPASQTMPRDDEKDIPSKVIYAWTYVRQTEFIWANSNTQPTILLTSEGNLYTGTDWTLNNYVILYKGTGIATYNSQYNVSIPILGVTSYIIDSEGNKAQTVNSEVGLVAVIKEELTEDEQRTFALELEAEMGKNPCFSV